MLYSNAPPIIFSSIPGGSVVPVNNDVIKLCKEDLVLSIIENNSYYGEGFNHEMQVFIKYIFKNISDSDQKVTIGFPTLSKEYENGYFCPSLQNGVELKYEEITEMITSLKKYLKMRHF